MQSGFSKIGIVIPWRETPSRLSAFNKLINWYNTNIPEAQIFTPDRPGSSWSMSGSRNDGILAATSAGCDVIVLNDADTFPQLNVLQEAMKEAFIDNKVHIPYQQTHILYQGETEAFLNDNLPDYYHTLVSVAECSGVNVFTPAAWNSIGGGDEKFIGWGYEDLAMNYVHKIVHGTAYISHFGYTIKLSHEDQSREDDNAKRNKSLYELYKTKTTAEEVLDIVKTKTLQELGIE